VRRWITAVSLIAASAAVAVPVGAVPHLKGRSFERTFPVASRLCARADDGRLPTRAQSSSDQIKAACATLHSSYDAAQSTLDSALSPLQDQIKTARQAVVAACQGAQQPTPSQTDSSSPTQTRDVTPPSTDRTACQQARQQFRSTVSSLKDQLKTIEKAYHESIQTARKAFWTTIQSLRAASSVTPDQSSPAQS